MYQAGNVLDCVSTKRMRIAVDSNDVSDPRRHHGITRGGSGARRGHLDRKYIASRRTAMTSCPFVALARQDL